MDFGVFHGKRKLLNRQIGVSPAMYHQCAAEYFAPIGIRNAHHLFSGGLDVEAANGSCRHTKMTGGKRRAAANLLQIPEVVSAADRKL